jgi:hypothetical protein
MIEIPGNSYKLCDMVSRDATLYKHLGIDANKTVLHDMAERPLPLVDSEHQPIPELI